MASEIISVAIRRSALKAVARAAAKIDLRYYLNGVYVESNPALTRIVATNGHMLAGYCDARDNQGECEIIIPNDVVKTALALKVPDSVKEIRMYRDINGSWRLGDVLFSPVDGKYPDWRRTIPLKLSGQAGYFNPDYLALFAKMARDLGKSDSPTVGYNGLDESALIDLKEEGFFGVCMPLRDAHKVNVSIASWALLKNAEASA